MATGYSSTLVGQDLVAGGAPLVANPVSVRPNNPQNAIGHAAAFGGSGRCRVALSRESEVDYRAVGAASFSGNGNWLPVDSLTKTIAGVGVNEPRDRRFTLRLRTHGGPVLLWANCTVVDTAAGQSTYFDVIMDGDQRGVVASTWAGRKIGSELAALRGDANGFLGFRGAEVNSGTGNMDFRCIVQPLAPGWHSFELIVSHTSGTSTSVIGNANPRQGADHDGWCMFGVFELPSVGGASPIGGLNPAPVHGIRNVYRAGQGNQEVATLADCPGWFASANMNETEGTYAMVSTTLVKMDSIKPVGITEDRFTKRVLSRGGQFVILFGCTVAATVVGAQAVVDVRLDGTLIGGGANGIDDRAEVASGAGSLAFCHVTRRLPPGWHTFELMGKTSAGTSFFGLGNPSLGTTNEGWMRMTIFELIPTV